MAKLYQNAGFWLVIFGLLSTLVGYALLLYYGKVNWLVGLLVVLGLFLLVTGTILAWGQIYRANYEIEFGCRSKTTYLDKSF